MANYDGSLEAVECHIHCVRYDVTFNRGAGGRLIWSHQEPNVYRALPTPGRSDASAIRIFDI
eukprot:scaffold13960_cov96-Skeletonema_marinoi.AAC.1